MACKSTLATALDRAASILTRRRSDLNLTAKKLIERETLSREELDLLLQQKAASITSTFPGGMTSVART